MNLFDVYLWRENGENYECWKQRNGRDHRAKFVHFAVVKRSAVPWLGDVEKSRRAATVVIAAGWQAVLGFCRTDWLGGPPGWRKSRCEGWSLQGGFYILGGSSMTECSVPENWNNTVSQMATYRYQCNNNPKTGYTETQTYWLISWPVVGQLEEKSVTITNVLILSNL